MIVVTLLCYGQAASAVSVVAIIEQLAAMGLTEHETKVAETLLDAGCEDTVPLSDIVKHLRDAGVPAGRALALKAALATGLGGLSRQVLACIRACFMLPTLQSSAVVFRPSMRLLLLPFIQWLLFRRQLRALILLRCVLRVCPRFRFIHSFFDVCTGCTGGVRSHLRACWCHACY